jgi:hypothetical protein
MLYTGLTYPADLRIAELSLSRAQFFIWKRDQQMLAHAGFEVLTAVIEYFLLGSNAVQSSRSLETFRRNILALFSGSNSEQSQQPSRTRRQGSWTFQRNILMPFSRSKGDPKQVAAQETGGKYYISPKRRWTIATP